MITSASWATRQQELFERAVAEGQESAVWQTLVKGISFISISKAIKALSPAHMPMHKWANSVRSTVKSVGSYTGEYPATHRSITINLAGIDGAVVVHFMSPKLSNDRLRNKEFMFRLGVLRAEIKCEVQRLQAISHMRAARDVGDSLPLRTGSYSKPTLKTVDLATQVQEGMSAPALPNVDRNLQPEYKAPVKGEVYRDVKAACLALNLNASDSQIQLFKRQLKVDDTRAWGVRSGHGRVVFTQGSGEQVSVRVYPITLAPTATDTLDLQHVQHRAIVDGVEYRTTYDAITPLGIPHKTQVFQEHELERDPAAQLPAFEPAAELDHAAEDRYALRKVGPTRDGQTTFRRGVLANFSGHCAVTGVTFDLEAAHVVSWRETGDQRVANGILMTGAIHRMYDAEPALFAIHPDTLVITFRPELTEVFRHLHGQPLAKPKFTRLDKSALHERWVEFMEWDNRTCHP